MTKRSTKSPKTIKRPMAATRNGRPGGDAYPVNAESSEQMRGSAMNVMQAEGPKPTSEPTTLELIEEVRRRLAASADAASLLSPDAEDDPVCRD